METAENYNRNAEIYEQRWSSYLRHTHRHFAERIQTSSTDVILDASCGTGLLAQQLVESDYSFEKFVLNDISEQMQQKAHQRLGDHPDISFSQYAWPNSEFDHHSFTKIFCLNAFHNYQYQQEVVEHFRDLLQSSGELLLLDWNNSGLFRPVNWLIKHWVPETINTKSLSQVQKMLEKASFRITEKADWHYKYWRFYFLKAVKISS